MLSDLSTFALVGQRYLDTQHDTVFINSVETELLRRKVIGARRALIEYLAASALWWNIIWWEWVSLDERDVRWGWISNFIAFGLAGLLIGWLFGVWGALVAVAILHLATLYLGLMLRRGSASDPGSAAGAAK